MRKGMDALALLLYFYLPRRLITSDLFVDSVAFRYTFIR